MTVFWIFLLLIPAAIFISMPFWRTGAVTDAEDPEIAALEAAREAKYREIRDVETDRQAGKLSEEDFDRLSGELKREAVDILDQLETLKGKES